ncbi:VOC family protein [Amycolatopsis sp. NBC_01488]|uniref:VOC family protein n=1 Tax=Amycolatopsis sp. NBC_01488 TaxID=2903563 RepID=UPI002E28868D|nr:VOC family protein [Amycolatopsis sp. NBC_01488]
MLRGMATVSYFADDHAAAQAWYTEFLGVEPYFHRPGYAEFRIGDHQHELGLIDRKYVPASMGGASGEIVYWHVDDLEATVARLHELGATEYEPVTERGPGFVTASVVDPFGNVLGVMTNAHYLAVLTERS